MTKYIADREPTRAQVECAVEVEHHWHAFNVHGRMSRVCCCCDLREYDSRTMPAPEPKQAPMELAE